MLHHIQPVGLEHTGITHPVLPSAPQLEACRDCPSSTVCCSVATRGGQIESPFLLPSDVAAIAGALQARPESFVENRVNTVTGNAVSFIRSQQAQGCRFHDRTTGHCEIYAVRPLDCRLFPLDIAQIDGIYYWILWQYCLITDNDLTELLAFGQQVLPLIADSLRDYATVPISGMTKTSYRVIRPLEFA
jgi:Fe-S-cluster containining protein